MNKFWVGTGRQKSAELGKSRQQSAVVDWKSAEFGWRGQKVAQSRQKSTFFNSSRSSENAMQADYWDRHTYWNIKGCGDAALVFTGKCLLFRRKECGDFCKRCDTNVPPQENGGNCMAKPKTERNLLFPSKEFRERVRKT